MRSLCCSSLPWLRPSMAPHRSRGRTAPGLAASSCGWLRAGDAAVAPIDSRLLTFDELLHQPPRVVVAVLHRWRLHEVRARALERSADAAVERQLGATHCIDDDPRRVGRVNDLQ